MYIFMTTDLKDKAFVSDNFIFKITTILYNRHSVVFLTVFSYSASYLPLNC